MQTITITFFFILILVFSSSTVGAKSISGQDLKIFHQAGIAMSQHNWEQAEKLLSQLHNQYPGNDYVSNNLAVTYFNQGRLDEAQELFSQIIGSTEPTRIAFENLQTLYGYSAAKAYSKGLNLLKPIELPTMIVRQINGKQTFSQDKASVVASSNKQTSEQPRIPTVKTNLPGSAPTSQQIEANQNKTDLEKRQEVFPDLFAEEKNRLSDPDVVAMINEPEKFKTDEEVAKTPNINSVSNDEETVSTSTANPPKNKAPFILQAREDKPSTTKASTRDDDTSSVALTQTTGKQNHPPATKQNALSPEEQLLAELNGWAKAWSEGDVNRYIDFYSPSYSPRGKSRKAWLKNRRSRVKATKRIQVNLSQQEVFINKKQNRANILFVQEYRSKNYRDKVKKRITWIKRNKRWVISQEVIVKTL